MKAMKEKRDEALAEQTDTEADESAEQLSCMRAAASGARQMR